MNRNRKAKQYDQRMRDEQAMMMAASLEFDEVLPEKLRDEECEGCYRTPCVCLPDDCDVDAFYDDDIDEASIYGLSDADPGL